MKGGHASSGPERQPNALRRDGRADGTIYLPAEGRQGEPPAWPLSKAVAAELRHWASLWATPQAVEWERLRLEREVAAYVRVLVRFEQPKALAGYGDQEKTRAENLGLTLAGLARRHWVIGGDAPAKVTTADDPARVSAKARFKSIEGGVAS